MRISFEYGDQQWVKAIVTDLTTDEVVENVLWVDLQWGIVCYAKSNEQGKIQFNHEVLEVIRIVRHGRFKVEVTSKSAHPNIKGKEFELYAVECTVESDQPVQRVIHPEQPPPNTQSVRHQADIEKEVSNDGKSEGEGTSGEA